MSGKRIAVIFTCASVLLLSLGIFFLYPQAERQRALFEKRRARWLALEEVLLSDERGFKGKSGMVIKDLDTNWQISFNKEMLFPSASVVKIPIMAALYKAAQDGRITFSQKIRLKASDKTAGSGELKNMSAGTLFSVEELIERMVVSSDNTAANMLIGLLGFQYLNRSFKEFGMKHTNLSRKMMDFSGRKNGVENYTTAADMAYLLEMIYRGKLINSFISQKCLGLLKKQKIRDRIPAQLPHETVVAHKTGLEMRVCHDAGIVFTAQGDFLICVLTKGVTNSRVSKKFIADIACEVYNSYN